MSYFMILCNWILAGTQVCSKEDFKTHLTETQRSLAEFFRIENVVSLETADRSLLGEIALVKVDPTSGDLLILERHTPKMVFRFSSEGRFLGTHGGPGFGPGESRRINHVAVFPDGRFVILDERHIALFSTGGKLELEIPIGYGVESAVVADHRLFVHYAINRNQLEASLLVYNENLRLVTGYHPFDPARKLITFGHANSTAATRDGWVGFVEFLRMKLVVIAPDGDCFQFLFDDNQNLIDRHLTKGKLRGERAKQFAKDLHRFDAIWSLGDSFLLREMYLAESLFRYVFYKPREKIWIPLKRASQLAHLHKGLPMKGIVGNTLDSLIAVLADSSLRKEQARLSEPQTRGLREDLNPTLIFLKANDI